MKNQTPNNIIVRMPNWLGDLVMATPILADLRHHFPSAKLTAMCLSSMTSLLAEDPNVDELFALEKRSGWIHRNQFKDVIRPLRHGQYDLGILLTNSFSSAWRFWRGNVKNRIGFKGNCRDWLLDQALPFPANYKNQHQVITYKALLEPLGIPISTTAPKLYVTEAEIDETYQVLNDLGINKESCVIGINPGAAYGTAKCWLPERFKELSQRLLKDPNNHLLFFGDRSASVLVQEICASLPERVYNFAGKTTLRQLMAYIQGCHAFITNDSGPMHIASALGTPQVAIFGSTSDVRTPPYEGGIVIHKHVACSPCYLRVCPIDFRCMKSISVDEVYANVLKILQDKKINRI